MNDRGETPFEFATVDMLHRIFVDNENDESGGTNNYFIKEGVELEEYKLQKRIYQQAIAPTPKVVCYSKATKTLVMHKVNGMNLSDM